ncbi:MAG: hypothetical protein QMD85_03235, partial [Candidatus Aenigmarchaeota archaeon]|nr:hypothetical protein [Candidatus Aenigmarchaeota archaeon]MDI6722555.1 hypothetical protein [Candidatus Aenigmarchaeota archaeon]
GQFPLIVAVANVEKTNIMKELREKIMKRHKGLASRRRIKSNDLTDDELQWFMSRLDIPFRAVDCDALQYRSFKSVYGSKPKWKFVYLALSYYSSIQPFIRDCKTNILIDKDYDTKSMKFMCTELEKILKKWDNVAASIRLAESGDECVALADIIAGAARRGLTGSVKPNIIELGVRYYGNK